MNSPYVHELTAENAAQIISQHPGILVIDFYAEWCQPCKTLKPIFEEVAQQYKDKYTFARIDIDKCQQIAAQLQITSIPTIVIFQGGQVLDTLTGLMPKETLIERIQEAANGPKDLSKLSKEALNSRLIQALQTASPIDTITRLIDAGADVNYEMPNKMTPLLMAIVMNANRGVDATELVKLLLSKGAATEFTEQPGKTMKVYDFVQLMSQNHKKIAESYDKLAELFKQ